MSDPRAKALFAAFVAMSVAHVAYIVALEPFSFDAWNVAVDTHGEPATLGRFLDYWQAQLAHGNPRLGQPLTYLAYKVWGFAEVITPLAFLGLTLSITILGLGRFPRRARDFALWAIAIGFCWFVLPQIGRNMFCRAYGANYIYGAAIQLAVLAALRLRAHDTEATKERIATYAMLGVAAGMCNEHTGPTLVLALLAIAAWRKRRGEQHRVFAACGIGALVGFLVIFLAPGQSERYSGLARRMGLVERVLDRGVAGAVDVLRDYIVYAGPLLLLFVLVLLASTSRDDDRGARRFVIFALAAGACVALTLLASPKYGSRFYIAPLALLLASFLAVADQLLSSRRLAILVGIAVLASSYAALRTIPLFREASADGDARMAELARAKPGDTYNAEPFVQVNESWWFIGDDFRDPKKRTMVAKYLGLAKVNWRDPRDRDQRDQRRPRSSSSSAPQPP